jgi:hypothetical protein
MRPAAGAGTRPPGLALALLLVAGCQRSASAPPERPVVGGLGRRLVAGPAANLRLSRDGAWATFLRNPARPALEGVNPDSVNPKTAQGELVAVSLADGSARTLARAVTNRPGAALFSPDGCSSSPTSTWPLGPGRFTRSVSATARSPSPAAAR